MLDLKGGEIHEKVMNSIEKFLKNGYENLPAVRMTLRKYKHLLEEMMYLTDDEETDDEETDSEDDGKNDEVDSGDETGEGMKVVNELYINQCDIVLFIHFVTVD